MRGAGATGLLEERDRQAYIDKHVPKALKVLARVNDRAGAHFCLVICTEADNGVSCMPHVSSGPNISQTISMYHSPVRSPSAAINKMLPGVCCSTETSTSHSATAHCISSSG